MKTMTCKQLGGACDLEFRGKTFEDMQAQSQAHGREMFEQKDSAHMAAMSLMREKIQSPEAMKAWMAEKRAEFDALPDNTG